MNTAAIPIRQASSTLRDLFAFEPEEYCIPYNYAAPEGAVETEPPAALRFEREVVQFQRAIGRHRDAARSRIVKRLLTAEDAYECIETVIQTLISSARPGRLDDAVDILSECGRLLPQFISEAVLQSQTRDFDEDFWYVVIRGLGKATLSSTSPPARLFVYQLWSRSPDAAVEALGDIGDDESLRRLRAVAAGAPSDLVRQLASQIVEECSER